ncbi:hypothetical protein N8579_00920 [bacterium]|nr:hypothetical protein [bacterium]
MEDKVLVFPVNNQTLKVEEYSSKDSSLIEQFEIDTSFTQSSDYIEYYIFDENQNLIYPQITEELLTYNIKEGHVLLDPKQDLQRLNFNEGNYYINYNFYKTHLNSSLSSKYYIEEISSDRTEIRLNSTTIDNELIESSTNSFIEYRSTQSYFVDFYLNFGENNLVIANNIKLDVINENDYSVLIKLYEPLPIELGLKFKCWVVESISTPQTYQVKFPIPIFDPQDFEFISGPNLSLNIKDESGVSSKEYSYETLVNSNITSSTSQIQSLLEEKGIKININYEDFNNFIKFSSAKTRLENFYYKVGLIEHNNNQIIALNNSITSPTTATTEFSSSKLLFENNISTIIKNFDSYEYFLYYNSGSESSYPKQNSIPPYNLYSTGSSQAQSWITSSLSLALNYDQDNQDYLHWNIPEYLRDDPNNSQYDLFIDMVGQHFDNIWVYVKDITNKFNNDNRLNYGISKDLVADAIKDFGIKLYSNNFNTNDLYEAFLGITPEGNTFPYGPNTDYLPASTGYEYIDNKISLTNNIVPQDDVNKSLYKRIYHNIPYLLKTKGTIAGLRALITSYGIPDTILRINEFGGKNPIKNQSWDYKENLFNSALEVNEGSYFSSSFTPNTDFSATNPDTIQFRFKTPGIPTSSLSQSLFSIEESGDSLLVLEYTGSGYESGSYSGSIVDPYNKYGTIKFIPDSTNPNLSASVYLPIFNNGWWSVMTTNNNITASLHVANSIENTLGFTSSANIVGYNSNSYNNGTKILFPNTESISLGGNIYSPFSGSIQEIRYYSPTISESAFYDYTLNPLSFKGNGLTTPEQLIFRADLGSLSSTSSRESIHPKVTGSWDLTSSFSSGNSNFILENPTFVSNKEYVHQNQPFQGIKNKVSSRINVFENEIPEGDTLSSKRSIQQHSFTTQSTTPDADYLEVAFSSTDQINDDITSELGNFNIGDYIGDPRHISESRTNYPDLDNLRDRYFKKYIKGYEVKDFVRLIKFFDNSLFKMIKDFTPARTNLSAGVVVKQHLLERSAYSSIPLSVEDQTYSGSIKSFARGYNTGSGDTGAYETINGSTIEVFKGGTGGIFEKFNNLKTSPSGSEGNGPNNIFGITQSWDENTLMISGTVAYIRDDQREFYNGEFSQSSHVKLQRGLNIGNDDPCYEFTNWENVPELLYRLSFFSGSNQDFTIEPYTPPPERTGSLFYISNTSGSGGPHYNDAISACNDRGTGSIYFDVTSIHNIQIGSEAFADAALTIPFTGSGEWYGVRTSDDASQSNINQFAIQMHNNISNPTDFIGQVEDKRLCKPAIQVVRVRNTADNTITMYVSVPTFLYQLGTTVNLFSTPGCWEIISTSTSTEILAEDTPSQICAPITTLYAIDLGYHASNAALACADSPNRYYADSPQFNTMTKLYALNSVSVSNYVLSGFVSNGSGYRYIHTVIDSSQIIQLTISSCSNSSGNNWGDTFIGEEEINIP